jgi:hypothetical protein
MMLSPKLKLFLSGKLGWEVWLEEHPWETVCLLILLVVFLSLIL